MEELMLDTIIYKRTDITSTVVDGEVGMMNIDRGKYFSLDPIGTRVWELLDQPMNIQDLVKVLMEEYEVDVETCQADVKELIEKLLFEDLVRTTN